jgi:hypothetical protein
MADTEERYPDTASALEAMAAGRADDEPAAETETEDVEPVVDWAAAPTADPAEVVPFADAPSQPGSGGAPAAGAGASGQGSRAARQADFQRKSRQSQSHQLKKMMVPLLLVTGLLLILMGAATTIITRGGASLGEDGPVSPGLARIMMITSFPLAIALLAGAWYFHRESRPDEAA